MCERYWGHRWELMDGPCAKAYRLLRSIDVGPEIGSARRPRLEFHEGAHPGDNSLWVNAMDQLSLSLLQARLIDLKNADQDRGRDLAMLNTRHRA